MCKWQNWIGRQQSKQCVIDQHHASLLAATLDQPAPQHGESLPPCWHWAWFNDALPPSQLGRDGHPKTGGFIPPLPLPRRMWAGGEINFIKPVRIDRNIRKRSAIEKIDEKNGSSGRLFVVTIRHQLFDQQQLCIDEIQNLVYRADPEPGAPAPQYPAAPKHAAVQQALTPDSTLMFRYSALTFNGHRIHYDADYARGVEGYPGLVFHAPLSATLLCQLGVELLDGIAHKQFRYRATAPIFCGETVQVCGCKSDNSVDLWIEKHDGIQAMSGVLAG